MKAWNDLASLVAILRHRRRRLAEVDRELEADLALEADEQQESGVPPAEARDAARRAFGNATLVAEDVRAVWTIAWIDAVGRDVRYAARLLRRNPGFALVAVLTLALGIGANTAMFTAVDALMLRPLPFERSDQLVRLYATRNGVADPSLNGPSPLDARDYAQASRSFQTLVVYDAWRKNVRFGETGAEPEQTRVGLVPAAYFEMLRIQPLFGRLFTDEENQEGRHYVAAISARVWQTRFAGDRQVLGRTLRINDEPYTIVAVMPDVIPEWMESTRVGRVEIWTPFAFSNVWSETARVMHGFSALARLKPGVTAEQAQADLSAIAARLAAEHQADRGIGVRVERLADTRVGTLRPMLWLLTAAVGLILLIACVNLANLLLARAATRQRELALRAALGAGRGGLVRQLLIETLLLSSLGAAVGLAVARLGLTAVMTEHPADLPQLNAIVVDWRVLTFTAAVSLVTSLLFGLTPALSATRLDLVDVLKQGGRSGTPGPSGRRLRNALIVAEIAMALMLLVGASLMVQSLVALQHQNLGIRQDHVLKGHLFLPPVRYSDPAAITRFCDAFAARVRALPGVIDATITTAYPPANGWTQMLEIPGRPVSRIEDIPTAQFGVADAHFLATMGIPLVRGRNFEDTDGGTSRPVAIVSAEFMRRYFPSTDPIGQQIHIGPPPFLQMAPGVNTSDSSDATIVGVAGDFRNAGLAVRPEPHVTVLYAQHPLVNYGFKDIVVRSASEPHALTPAIAGQLHQLDPELPFAEVQTIDEVVAQQTGRPRLTTILLTLFAAGGFALAIIGIYGVVSCLVAQRKVELAVRMAVGASHAAVLGLVLRQSLSVAAVGAVLGLFGAAAAQRLMSGLLFGISPIDPATFTGAALFLLTVAAAATLIPALRATRIDPARTLCQD